ncbi:hypothetical protein CFIMG_007365RA00001 [Ceratocystis fimbriata CBS 114723]|uniref:Glycosyltransferase 2-like domain-containing protein n=1 Tax=Ceratocystis fimbriata CBS 114723 TaxID=1035309 RepID=A0A2C5XH80_9PEZI|nr:hypothetical protein CFIMG_007365RA00001 [Ceratocystis fimbriata CBS 114723]
MAVLEWCTRRVGGLSWILLIIISAYVLLEESKVNSPSMGSSSPVGLNRPEKSVEVPHKGAGAWTVVWAYYCLALHAMVAVFPIRACYAISSITKAIRQRTRTYAVSTASKFPTDRRGSCISLNSFGFSTLVSPTVLSDSSHTSSSSESTDGDFQPGLCEEEALSHVIHAIIVPNYKEEMETLRETLDVLASHPLASFSYDIYLGMEQREAEAEQKATALVKEYYHKFRRMAYTMHPTDVAGESAGKGSNEAWVARELSQSYYPLTARKNVIVTGIDADSHIAADYFNHLDEMHTAYPETAATTLYAAPIIFDRNADSVPGIVRVADILWCAGGISGLYCGSTVAPPTSVYSLPLQLIDRVGGWDSDCEAIGEDLHMYLKCLFALNGNLTCRTIFSPVSQTNVSGNGKEKGLRGLRWDTEARYKQALRHMWGSLDSGFALRQIFELWRERNHTSRAFRPLHTALGDDSDSFVPLGEKEGHVESGIFSDITHDTLKPVDWRCILVMVHRMFEAHFLPLHMTIMVIASALYVWIAKDSGDIHNIDWIFQVTGLLRGFGFFGVVLYMFLYESFHTLCVTNRQREMMDVGLAEGMHFSFRSWRRNIWDYGLAPVVAPMFGSVPCAQAQLMHFWTLDLAYSVSKKITRMRLKVPGEEV